MHGGDDDNAGAYSHDGFLGGKLRLRQPRDGFRSGHDAVLLAASAGPAAKRPCCRIGQRGRGRVFMLFGTPP